MPQPSKNYGARYSVPVSQAGAAMVDAEVKYQKEHSVDGRCKPVGQLLGEIVEEGIRARMKARGVEPSQMPAVLPGEAADPASVPMPQEGADPILAADPPPAEAA